MLFRKNLFTGLAVLTGVLVPAGLCLLLMIYQLPTRENMGDWLYVGGLRLALCGCTGIPAFIIFSLLAWRNSVGLREEQRHWQEMNRVR